MKQVFLFSFFTFFAFEVLAKESDFGIFKQIISQATEEIAISESSTFQPKLSSSLVYDIDFNDEYQSTDRANEFRDTTSKGRLNSSFKFTRNLSLNSFLKLERSSKASEEFRRSQSQNGGGDRSFEDEGIAIQELNIAYEGKKHAFILGKFDLNFGTAWRFDRGIWSHDIAQNYRQTEKLGAGGFYRIGDSAKTGRYKFSYAVFTNDRKNLDNSIITKRDSDYKSDAVAGGDRSLQSYITSLDVDFDFAENDKLTYHFSYSNLAVNSRYSSVVDDKIADQKSWVAGMNYKFPIKNNFTLDGLLEYADIKNLDGNSDAKENYLTANLIGRFYENWNVTLGHSKHRNSVLNDSSYCQNLSEISFGYEFKKAKFFDGLLFQIGYKNQREDYRSSLESRNSLGALMRYQKFF